MLTYDSPKSIAAEAKKIAEYKDANGKSLLGIKMFHVQGDYCAAGPKEANGPLARAARGAWA